jgi:hypothetical protein
LSDIDITRHMREHVLQFMWHASSPPGGTAVSLRVQGFAAVEKQRENTEFVKSVTRSVTVYGGLLGCQATRRARI